MEVMTWSLEAMRYWMDQNRLKLNPSKIQLLFVDDRSGLVPVLSLAQDWVVFSEGADLWVGQVSSWNHSSFSRWRWRLWLAGNMLWLMHQFARLFFFFFFLQHTAIMASIAYCSHAAAFENDWELQLDQNAVTRLPMDRRRLAALCLLWSMLP